MGCIRASLSVGLAPVHAYFGFYAELNDHLPARSRYKTLEKSLALPSTVNDMIESFGVPHAEAELIVINGESTDFSRLLGNGDFVSVYPKFEAIEIAPELRVPVQARARAKVRARCP